MTDNIPKPQTTQLPIAKPSRTATSPEMRAVKKHSNLKLILGVVGAIAGTGGGGYLTNRSNADDTKTEVAVVKEQLSNHIQTSDERNEELKREQRRLNRRTSRIEKIQLINKAQNDLVLDKLGVPKSKRPTAENTPVAEDED